MANGFITIPDWFSFENQGAGVALADLSGGGPRDLVVLMVDSPPGQNRGFYRVGKGIAADGTATGGWTGLDGGTGLVLLREPGRRRGGGRPRRRRPAGADRLHDRQPSGEEPRLLPRRPQA